MAVSAMYLVAIFGIFGSITGSVNRLADGVAGIAALEVSGITDAGFPDTITADVAAVPGVAVAAPMIRTSASTSSGPILLFGADESIAALGGALKDALIDGRWAARQGPPGPTVSRRARRRSCERRDVPTRLGSVTVSEVLDGQAARRPQRRALCPCPTCVGAEHHRATGPARLDPDHHQTRRRPRPGSRRRHHRGERPGNRRRPQHAGDPGRRRRQADELHGPDGRDGRIDGRRVPDLHHDDHGDHPAPARHLDAARDRRPPRHHRPRHARGGRDPGRASAGPSARPSEYCWAASRLADCLRPSPRGWKPASSTGCPATRYLPPSR